MHEEDPGLPLILAALETRVFCAYVAGRSAREVESGLVGNPFGLTGTSIALLHALRQGDKTIAEISRFLPVSQSTLVSVVDGLEERGLARRGRDRADRRRNPISITARGRDALASAPAHTGYAAILKALDHMEPGQARQLADLLGELVRHMGGDEVTRGTLDAIRTGIDARYASHSERNRHDERGPAT